MKAWLTTGTSQIHYCLLSPHLRWGGLQMTIRGKDGDSSIITRAHARRSILSSLASSIEALHCKCVVRCHRKLSVGKIRRWDAPPVLLQVTSQRNAFVCLETPKDVSPNESSYACLSSKIWYCWCRASRGAIFCLLDSSWKLKIMLRKDIMAPSPLAVRQCRPPCRLIAFGELSGKNNSSHEKRSLRNNAGQSEALRKAAAVLPWIFFAAPAQATACEPPIPIYLDCVQMQLV